MNMMKRLSALKQRMDARALRGHKGVYMPPVSLWGLANSVLGLRFM